MLYQPSNHRLSLLFFLFILSPSLSSAGPLSYQPDEVLVKFKSGTTSKTFNAVNFNQGSTVLKQVAVNVQRLRLKSGISVTKAIENYSRDPNVEYAQPNYVYYLDAIPNDTYFSSLWGLHNNGQTVNGTAGTLDADIDAPQAWDITMGNNNSIVVAVIDSGVLLTHPDLAANLVTGYDFFDDDNDPTDYDSHGTHVAGVIGAVGNNSLGVIGVNPNAKIMPLRSLGVTGAERLNGLTSTVVPAIDYAVTHGAKVINASFGGANFDQLLYNAVKRASDAGILFVAAAGNNGLDNAVTHHYPCDFELPNIISVAASDPNDALASFSNYGSTVVHITAPGTNVYSSTAGFSYSPVFISSTGFDSDTLGQLPALWKSTGINCSWTISDSTYTSPPYCLEDSTGANYLNGTDSIVWYDTPVPYVKNTHYKLDFNIMYDLASGPDYFFVIFSSDAQSWSTIDSLTGSSTNAFLHKSIDLTLAADLFKSFYFGFEIFSDASGTADGVHIDDVVLTRENISGTYGYSFNPQGTSMAAPYVSGIASLVLSYNPTLSVSKLKNIILNGVDKKAGLTGKVLTGGRVNAYNSLLLTPAPPLPVNFTSTIGLNPNAPSEIVQAVFNTPNISSITVSMPAGAVNAGESLVITENSAPPPATSGVELIGGALDIKLGSGKTNFIKPVTFAMAVNSNSVLGQLAGRNSNLVKAAFHNGVRWVVIPNSVYAGGKVNFTVDHLTKFAPVIAAPPSDLSNVSVYPNPVNPSQRALTFDGLSANSTIKLYDVSGALVKTIAGGSSANTGTATWDGKNEDGADVRLGLYIYVITGPSGNKATGKIGVKR